MEALLFTDIEGSTRLWEEHAEAMAKALARHDDLLTAAVAASSGRVLKHTGDGLIAVFPDSASSIDAAMRAQFKMAEEEWPETGPIRIRIGIHAGDTEHRDGDQFGPVMNRAARIMAAGHGGQILLSQAAAADADLPPGASLIDLGMHRLKDLTAPERLFQLDCDGLVSDFPPPRTLDSRPNNLPQQTSEFLGRANDLESVRSMLNSRNTRLVTLAGPGGAGKTRLALQVAAEQLEYCEDGVFFVDLASTTTLEEALEAIVRTLELPYNGGGDLIRFLTARLRERRMLLILDNFEQVTSAAVGVVELLQGAPELKVLVTSRETLRVRGERVYPVPPLGLPHPDQPASSIVESEAVMLFAERARGVAPDFAITDRNARTIAQIVLRLDGLPLAIELAAARMNVFSPDELLDRLRGRLEVLGSGGRDLPDRQRTLWSAIAWSYELLEPSEREVFEGLSVFSSTDLMALESVFEGSDAVGAITSLVEKSLVRAPEVGGTRRFSMLLTIKEFATDRLAHDSERLNALHTAHATYFQQRAKSLAGRLESEREWVLEETELDAGNLNAAWRHLIDIEDTGEALNMLRDLWVLYEAKGWYRAAIDIAGDGISLVEGSDDWVLDELALRTARARATMAVRGYTTEVEAEFQKALALSDALTGSAERASILRSLATYYMAIADLASAGEYGRSLLDLAEETGDTRLLVEGSYVFGVATALSGNFEEGIPILDRAIELQDPRAHHSTRYGLGPNTGVVALTASGLISWLIGKPDQAVDRLSRALAMATTMGHPYSVAFALHHNAFLALMRSRFDESVDFARRLAELAHANEYVVWETLATTMEGVARTCQGDFENGPRMTDMGIELYQGTVAPPVFWPFMLALRALVHAMAGDTEAALRIADEAIMIGSPTQEVNADLRLMVAQARFIAGDVSGAAQTFTEARQGAAANRLAMTELQALTGLVTIRRSLGIEPDGSDELAAVYAKFQEGLGEAPLVAAAELLGNRDDREPA